MSKASYLQEKLLAMVGIDVDITDDFASCPTAIRLNISDTHVRFGIEGYSLSVQPTEIIVSANTAAGLFYGIQTLLQLLPVETPQDNLDAGIYWSVPCVEVEDTPRFSWRGVMLDVSRHFMSMEFLYKLVDVLAMHKINTLHLHLTDDQGWRLEILKYPKLTSVGAFRSETLVGFAQQSPSDDNFNEDLQRLDGVPHGGFYTQAQMRGLIDFASKRHITIVPEIEMPGHAQAAIAAYPELGCPPVPVKVSPYWGVHSALFNPYPKTFSFLQDVVDEVMDLFPSHYIHIGGDEAIKTEWKNSPDIQLFMRDHEIENEEALQSYFIKRMDDYLMSKGRRLVGWDEILQGGLAENAVVMSWRGEIGGITAAEQGHDVVMAPYSHTYLDYYQNTDRQNEPLAFPETLLLETVYAYEPVSNAIPLDQAHHVLGAQAQLWTEYMPTPGQVEYMAFPRIAALAEVVWTTAERRSYPDFLRRLPSYFKRLSLLDTTFCAQDNV
jgi:hexosaminidase